MWDFGDGSPPVSVKSDGNADPQALQLLQENFPRGIAITLTPWEPQELWPWLAVLALALLVVDWTLFGRGSRRMNTVMGFQVREETPEEVLR